MRPDDEEVVYNALKLHSHKLYRVRPTAAQSKRCVYLLHRPSIDHASLVPIYMLHSRRSSESTEHGKTNRPILAIPTNGHVRFE